MKFVFPKQYPTLRIEKDHFDWWSVYIWLPMVFVGEDVRFGDVYNTWKIEAPTQINFESNENWHSFNISFLGFGFGYARQWGY